MPVDAWIDARTSSLDQDVTCCSAGGEARRASYAALDCTPPLPANAQRVVGEQTQVLLRVRLQLRVRLLDHGARCLGVPELEDHQRHALDEHNQLRAPLHQPLNHYERIDCWKRVAFGLLNVELLQWLDAHPVY